MFEALPTENEILRNVNRSNIRAMNDAAARLNALAAEVNRLRMDLAVANAKDAGRIKIVEEYRKLHPNGPLDRIVGKFEDGAPKTVRGTLFEQGFDAKMREQGIQNPERFRDR